MKIHSFTVKIEDYFGAIGSLIRSLAFSILGLLFFLSYRVFEVQNLFIFNLPEHLTGKSRLIASWLIAFVFIVPTLLFMSNNDYLKNLFSSQKTKGVSVPTLMAYITFFVNLFFWRVWEGSLEIIIFKILMSIITAYFDYMFSELFNKKYENWLRANEIVQDINQQEKLISKNKETIGIQETKLVLLNNKIDLSKDDLRITNEEIQKHKKGLETYACPYCFDYVGENQQGLNRHIGSCKSRKEELLLNLDK